MEFSLPPTASRKVNYVGQTAGTLLNADYIFQLEWSSVKDREGYYMLGHMHTNYIFNRINDIISRYLMNSWWINTEIYLLSKNCVVDENKCIYNLISYLNQRLALFSSWFKRYCLGVCNKLMSDTIRSI